VAHRLETPRGAGRKTEVDCRTTAIDGGEPDLYTSRPFVRPSLPGVGGRACGTEMLRDSTAISEGT
jgi:hypothetical protein